MCDTCTCPYLLFFCGITILYHRNTTALLHAWYFMVLVLCGMVFPMVFLVPHMYHRLLLCSTTGICVVSLQPCVITLYHINTTALLYDISVVYFFSVVFPMVFLYHMGTTGDTSAVPQESVWAFSSLWYFLWYYTVPHKYHSTVV